MSRAMFSNITRGTYLHQLDIAHQSIDAFRVKDVGKSHCIFLFHYSSLGKQKHHSNCKFGDGNFTIKHLP